MGNIHNRMRKSSRKELKLKKTEEEKVKERERSYKCRHSTYDNIISLKYPL